MEQTMDLSVSTLQNIQETFAGTVKEEAKEVEKQLSLESEDMKPQKQGSEQAKKDEVFLDKCSIQAEMNRILKVYNEKDGAYGKFSKMKSALEAALLKHELESLQQELVTLEATKRVAKGDDKATLKLRMRDIKDQISALAKEMEVRDLSVSYAYDEYDKSTLEIILRGVENHLQMCEERKLQMNRRLEVLAEKLSLAGPAPPQEQQMLELPASLPEEVADENMEQTVNLSVSTSQNIQETVAGTVKEEAEEAEKELPLESEDMKPQEQGTEQAKKDEVFLDECSIQAEMNRILKIYNEKDGAYGKFSKMKSALEAALLRHECESLQQELVTLEVAKRVAKGDDKATLKLRMRDIKDQISALAKEMEVRDLSVSYAYDEYDKSTIEIILRGVENHLQMCEEQKIQMNKRLEELAEKLGRSD